jgi:hypothetical protein
VTRICLAANDALICESNIISSATAFDARVISEIL